jgi:uracil-DNA glycosylase
VGNYLRESEGAPMAAAELEAIAHEIRMCTLCPLHGGRVRAVPGEGPTDAKIMFIGEGPGFNEDRQGRPFVGAAGQFLDELLMRAGMRREEVFITNVVKCRPPGNRDPQADEIAICTNTYLDRQIAVIDPAVIVTLGRFSMQRFLPNERIMRIHGQPRTVRGRLVVPMIHPAAALHQPQNRPLLEADFEHLPAILAHAEQQVATPDHPPDESAEQLSLF